MNTVSPADANLPNQLSLVVDLQGDVVNTVSPADANLPNQLSLVVDLQGDVMNAFPPPMQLNKTLEAEQIATVLAQNGGR